MIGDRASDIAAGRANHMLTIGCTYGYAAPGELDQADLQSVPSRICSRYCAERSQSFCCHLTYKQSNLLFRASRSCSIKAIQSGLAGRL